MKYAGKCLYIKQHETTHTHTVHAMGGGRGSLVRNNAGTSRAYGDEMKLVNLLKVR